MFVASGASFPDALSVAAVAGHLHAPVLLTSPTSLPASTKAELLRLAPPLVVVAGGTASVSAAVVSQINTLLGVPVTRLAGADRYATSAAVSAWAYPGGASSVFLAAGTAFPDALSGAVAAGLAGVPMLLTNPDACRPRRWPRCAASRRPPSPCWAARSPSRTAWPGS